jgi:hypothetical protein
VRRLNRTEPFVRRRISYVQAAFTSPPDEVRRARRRFHLVPLYEEDLTKLLGSLTLDTMRTVSAGLRVALP